MTKNLRKLAGLTLAAAATLALGSCAHDPYYSSASIGYDSGPYGYGYGYGGSSFSTTTFISTGNPRWGYDPHVRAYYDYNRRAYYDPYLYGYYPVGYRPYVVTAAPHPYGWRPGARRIAPPSRITRTNLRNYHDRSGAYRQSNHSWARQVQQQQRGRDVRRDPRQRTGSPAWQQQQRQQPRQQQQSSPRYDRGPRTQTRNMDPRLQRGAGQTGQQWVNTRTAGAAPTAVPRQRAPQQTGESRRMSQQQQPAQRQVQHAQRQSQQAQRQSQQAQRQAAATRQSAVRGTRTEAPARRSAQQTDDEERGGRSRGR